MKAENDNGREIPGGPMRMLVELDRKDDPALYDELARFRQGTKRINRLRLMAHQALEFSALVLSLRQQIEALKASPPEVGVPVPPDSASKLHLPFAADAFDSAGETCTASTGSSPGNREQ